MIILVESKMPFDEAIFADTTAEVPATSYHLENVGSVLIWKPVESLHKIIALDPGRRYLKH